MAMKETLHRMSCPKCHEILEGYAKPGEVDDLLDKMDEMMLQHKDVAHNG